MWIAENWKDYKLLDTSDGERLEKWGDYILVRPDPQVIWPSRIDMSAYKSLNAKYTRSESGGGEWQYVKKMPQEWTVSYGDLKFKVKPMGFKHTGLFPEQAVNWDLMTELIKNAE